MSLTKLLDIIGEAQTLPEAFERLKNFEIGMYSELASTYEILLPRREFVILQNTSLSDGRQFLHPYGTNVGYFITKEKEKAKGIAR